MLMFTFSLTEISCTQALLQFAASLPSSTNTTFHAGSSPSYLFGLQESEPLLFFGAQTGKNLGVSQFDARMSQVQEHD